LPFPGGPVISKAMPPSFQTRPPRSPHAPVALGLVVICGAIEVALSLSSYAIGDTLRRAALLHGAFWTPLLTQWEPIYPGQRYAMFITYAFLHSGVMHALFNMLVLLHLAREAVARLGQSGFLLLYVLTAIGGGAGFALLGAAPGPMVGASGAVFGMLGVTQFWDFQRRRAVGAGLGPFWRAQIGLVVLNLVLWVLAGGFLAWEAHLGGYVTGFVLAAIVTPTLRHGFRGFR
jgi:rhomboid protease GluP